LTLVSRMAQRSTGTRNGWTSTSSRPERVSGRNPRPYRPRVLRDAGISPAKALGQHFLIDLGIANRIVAAAELTAEDTVIEVGPGLGVLTERLVEVAGRVIAVEVDARLAQRLSKTLAAEHANLAVIQRDILSVDPAEILGLGLAGLAESQPKAPSPPSAWTERGLGGEVSVAT